MNLFFYVIVNSVNQLGLNFVCQIDNCHSIFFHVVKWRKYDDGILFYLNLLTRLQNSVALSSQNVKDTCILCFQKPSDVNLCLIDFKQNPPKKVNKKFKKYSLLDKLPKNNNIQVDEQYRFLEILHKQNQKKITRIAMNLITLCKSDHMMKKK